ncbi:hypothetical protein V8G54_030954 [Vigna mungo]|uniref:Uncharacterized protein n=1 Tax=Vigna mungo TaxID=3915 RepID=A0AAQ3RNF7_VIGMU
MQKPLELQGLEDVFESVEILRWLVNPSHPQPPLNLPVNRSCVFGFGEEIRRVVETLLGPLPGWICSSAIAQSGIDDSIIILEDHIGDLNRAWEIVCVQKTTLWQWQGQRQISGHSGLGSGSLQLCYGPWSGL